MTDEKAMLQEKFSKDYEKYYLVDLFKRKGFVRKKCENCGKHFWTLKLERTRCDDQPCSPYTFIGDSPTKTKLDYIGTWKKVEEFFRSNGHTIVPRYPVVARWRPDLYFTVASIIDFQRIEGGKVIFELPANPLVVPQMCLRFNDLPTVGVNGKHNSSFCMIGQTALANKEGYWKDKCIDLDFELVTRVLGIPEEELSFIEGVWVGYGAFGYCLDYFVRGLELGNAVFTAFEGNLANFTEIKEKVIDMGAGLERLAWITQGTPTSYDVTFAPVLKKMMEVSPIEYDHGLFLRYSRIAGALNIDDYPDLTQARGMIAKTLGVSTSELTEKLAPVEALYTIADHSRTLLFAIADGLLPSNVGGGYNLRVVFRRAQSFIERYSFKFEMVDVINWHIDHLREMFPELEQHRGDVTEVLDVEATRYNSAKDRVAKTVAGLIKSNKKLATDDLVKLYESDGITPEQLAQAGLPITVPDDFYQRVVAKHEAQKADQKGPKYDITGLPDTRLLYYEDVDLFDFDATVLKTYEGGLAVLDKTAFYPRGGGQEPDHGTLGGLKVTDVTKYGAIVIHKLEGTLPSVGSVLQGRVDSVRRQRIKRIHTATHILNGASRQVLGPWVWQHSAFKEQDYGRLDITHFAHLTEAEVQKIEDVANDVVMRDLPVTISEFPRKEAEERYGFRLFQGGVVPSKNLRIVNIADWDVQACGGTHVKTTGEVGLIKIVKTERIQDGVERLDFVAGYAAVEYVQKVDSMVNQVSALLATQRENIPKVVASLKGSLDELGARERSMGEMLVTASVPHILSSAVDVKAVRLYLSQAQNLSEELVIAQGQKAIAADARLVYLDMSLKGNSARAVCFVGKEAAELGVSADSIVKETARILGGSGGGTKVFAQGGGPKVERLKEAWDSVGAFVASQVK
jgi:alanyl-tRNA synthetase